ncbi:MAG: radical SAM protein [Flavisolibacter sp.]|jgi:MoaA/NifB/PqqE/SkfB family radical SAM enzyme|nr:radical SAM protein [Flavisolibacter sp.]
MKQSLYHTYKRFRTLQTGVISAMPILILMPHSACNCRCLMCDIWKGNHDSKQLLKEDMKALIEAMHQLGTKQVVLSGGEALIHPDIFVFCALMKQQGLHITLLTTGLTLKRHAIQVVEWVDDVIVSLDGDEALHNATRNISNAYGKLSEGINAIRTLSPGYKISGRCVIQRSNFMIWSKIIDTAKSLSLTSISFLPADVSSEAFNRTTPWENARQQEVLIPFELLGKLQYIIKQLVVEHQEDFASGFILENKDKIKAIGTYYEALHGLSDFPEKNCNAPWVSAVVEANGDVRPCFFHKPLGNIRSDHLTTILNSRQGRDFRRTLDTMKNETCKRCVCSLSLPAFKNPVA